MIFESQLLILKEDTLLVVGKIIGEKHYDNRK